ncbi:autotransporter domain-containing protein, partial [Mesorhizobium sp. M7A.F.Ca.CA.002.05.1.1]|uniref:autotransporter-associated beta strand repeat-containing protein n=1 Tax=Mesorhizobium sp. M7A.F.Ca.CA.002.05.1.1 TaxID=2496704 RepID=UPI000FD4D43F
SGTVQGGTGGASGYGDPRYRAGSGGIGIAGAGLTVTNSGTIAGGFSIDGNGPQAHAIQFTGGVNTLELHAGSVVSGTVEAFSAADTFGLGGSVGGSFDLSQLGAAGSSAQYQGFGILEKSGTGTWTISGTPGTVMAWSVTQGILDLGATTQTATGFTLTGGELRNGTLSTAGSFALSNGTVSALLGGTGSLVKSGTGTVVLTGTNTYSGGTFANGGTLRIG